MTQGGPSGVTAPTPDLSVLSDREREVLELIAQGLRSSEIAARLGRALPTIKSHRQQIGRKLGARTRVDLARIAFEAFRAGDDARDRALEVLARPRGGMTVSVLLTELAGLLGVEGALLARDDGPGRVVVIDHMLAGALAWTGPLSTSDGPFAGEMSGPVCHGPRAREAFPQAADLQALGASFVTGARLETGEGHPFGLLVAYDRGDVEPDKKRCAILRAFASRLGAEIEARGVSAGAE